MSTARAIAAFCRWRERQPRSAGADIVIEPDIDDGLAQRQRVDHLGEHRRDPHRRIGLAIGDLAEQDVVLHRGCGVIALGVEELDLLPRLGRQIGAEYSARFEQPLSASPRRATSSRCRAGISLNGSERSFARSALASAAAPPLADPPEDGDEFRQIARADKAELLEELVIGRQVGKQLDHRLGHLFAGSDQIFGQPDLGENLQTRRCCRRAPRSRKRGRSAFRTAGSPRPRR